MDPKLRSIRRICFPPKKRTTMVPYKYEYNRRDTLKMPPAARKSGAHSPQGARAKSPGRSPAGARCACVSLPHKLRLAVPQIASRCPTNPQPLPGAITLTVKLLSCVQGEVAGPTRCALHVRKACQCVRRSQGVSCPAAPQFSARFSPQRAFMHPYVPAPRDLVHPTTRAAHNLLLHETRIQDVLARAGLALAIAFVGYVLVSMLTFYDHGGGCCAYGCVRLLSMRSALVPMPNMR